MKEETLAGTETRLGREKNEELAPVALLPSSADSRTKQKEPRNKLKPSRRQPHCAGSGDIPASVQPCEKVASS